MEEHLMCPNCKTGYKWIIFLGSQTIECTECHHRKELFLIEE